MLLPVLLLGCATQPGGFTDDVAFMKKHTEIILLKKGKAAVAVAPDYQGRVMTSAINRKTGDGFGWINRPVIETGVLPESERKGKLEEHIHIFGGEERFWLGPEGGQFGFYFKPGSEFVFEDWTTPAAIDTEPFELVVKSADRAVFRRDCELTNYSGTVFTMGIERTVRLLDADAVEDSINQSVPQGVEFVAFETDNRLTNRGKTAWKAETGLPSIWLLGHFSPSPSTTIVIPFESGPERALGPKVNGTYFGKVPPEYLTVEDDVLFFRGDGTRRGKIGVSPERSKGVAGSYDAEGQVLTLLTYNQQAAPNGFVNSMWEFQKEPYKGDVINSYNDGSPAPGKPPLGPFYELETSSPAAALKPGETMQHIQQTMHFHGSEEALEPLARNILGVGLQDIKTVNQTGSNRK
ncbi:DUF6786 family protein [Pontiella agarivorans]